MSSPGSSKVYHISSITDLTGSICPTSDTRAELQRWDSQVTARARDMAQGQLAGTAPTHRHWDRDRFCSHSSISSPEDSSDGFSESWLSSLLSPTSLTSGSPVGCCAWFGCQIASSSFCKEELVLSFWAQNWKERKQAV